MEESNFQVIVKAKALAVHSLKITSNCNRYPKKWRHTLVDRIQIKSMNIYEALMEANRIDNKTRKRERCEMITSAITQCDALLTYIEMSMELDIVSAQSAGYWSKMVKDVKYMSIAWRTKERQ